MPKHLRSLSFYDFQIICCKLPFIFVKKFHCIRFFLNSKYLSLIRPKGHLHRNRSGSGSHIVTDGILMKFQFGKGNASHLFLCHRRFSPDKFFISDSMGRKCRRGVFIISTDHTQSLSFIRSQFTGFCRKYPFLRIG